MLFKEEVLGALFGLSISFIISFIIYILLDCQRLRIIKFKREDKYYWEIAFSEKELQQKLEGKMADVIMPEKPIIIRWYRYFFPLKGQQIEIYK